MRHDFFASARLAREYGGDFPHSLDGAPLLAPGEDAAIRLKLMRWFEMLRIRPRIMGEFGDGVAGGFWAGVGIFAVPLGHRRASGEPTLVRMTGNRLFWIIHSCRIF